MMQPLSPDEDLLVAVVRAEADAGTKAARTADIVGYRIVAATQAEPKHVVYDIAVRANGTTYQIERRYSQFRRLYQRLRSECPAEKLTFPQKRRVRNNFSPEFLEARTASLRVFLETVLSTYALSRQLAVFVFFQPNEQPEQAESLEALDSVLLRTASDVSCLSAGSDSSGGSIERRSSPLPLLRPPTISYPSASPAKIHTIDTGTKQVELDLPLRLSLVLDS